MERKKGAKASVPLEPVFRKLIKNKTEAGWKKRKAKLVSENKKPVPRKESPKKPKPVKKKPRAKKAVPKKSQKRKTSLELIGETKSELEKLKAKHLKDEKTRKKIKHLSEKMKRVETSSQETKSDRKLQTRMLKGIEKTIKEQRIPPIQIILNNLNKTESPDEKIKHYRDLLKRAKYEFYKMNLSTDQYKRMVLEYEHNIRELLMKKKVDQNKKKEQQKITVNLGKQKKTGKNMPIKVELGEAQPAQAISPQEPQVSELQREKEPAEPAEAEKPEITPEKPKPVLQEKTSAPKPIKQEKPSLPKPAAPKPVEAVGKTKSAEKPENKTKPTASKVSGSNINEIKSMFKQAEEENKMSETGAASIGAERRDQEIQEIVRKHAPNISPDEMKLAESKISKAMEKYNMNQNEMSRQISRIGADRVVRDFDKLIGMIERDREGDQTARREVIPEMPKTAMEQKEEKKKTVSKDIKELDVVTDYDKILKLVKEKGSITAKNAAKELGIKMDGFTKCCQVLEDSRLIKLEYPAIGSVKIVDIDYDPKKKEENKDKGEEEK